MEDKAQSVIGKLHKPKASNVIGKRKAYLVMLVPVLGYVNSEFDSITKEYWKEVDEHVTLLEQRAGIIKKIFSEGTPGKGEDAKVALERTYPHCAELITSRMRSGASFERMEDDDLLYEVVDWSRFLQSPFQSRKVADKAQAFYTEAITKRATFNMQSLDQCIGEGESALVFVNSFNLGMPAGIEKFVISPVALSKLESWISKEMTRIQQESVKSQSTSNQQSNSQQQSNQKRTKGGLWLPD